MANRRRARTAPLLVALALTAALAACSDVAGPVGDFSNEAIDYYVEVALGAEFGNVSPVVRKWTAELVIRVEGDPAPTDLAELDRVIAELNQLRTGPRIGIAAAGQTANVAIHFAPESTFSDILPQYVPVNRGFFWFWFNGQNVITSAVILIDNTDAIGQAFRNHLIREEVTQVLGLANDSPRHAGSIFHASDLPAPTEYSPLDREVIRIHDLPEIRAGMTEAEVRAVLGG